MKHNIYGKEAKFSEERTGYRQAQGQKCLQLQSLDQAREIAFSKDDISQGAKLTIYYLEPRDCGRGIGSGFILGTEW